MNDNSQTTPQMIENKKIIAHLEISKFDKLSLIFLNWSGRLLIVTVWLSAGLFGLYILAFYAFSVYSGNMMNWNHVLPDLYKENSVVSTTGIGIHFLAGGIILLLGSIQLLDWVRMKYPSLHRWVGRLYLVSSLFAAIGGLTFIAIRGTVGGLMMDIGFSLYGILMLVATVLTYHYAVRGRFESHYAWALRLYALAIGSWLYRMDYGFWTLLTGGLGRTSNFSGPFDQIMDFFFYVPNLLVAEVFIRVKKLKTHPILKITASLILMVATGFILMGTYFI